MLHIVMLLQIYIENLIKTRNQTIFTIIAPKKVENHTQFLKITSRQIIRIHVLLFKKLFEIL